MSEDSLLDNEPVQTDIEDDAPTEQPASWYHAEGVAGEGDAPEWLKGDKYKSVAAQAEAYKDLESKFGGFTGAPDEDYETSLPEGITGEFLEDNPLLDSFKEIAKEANMSQDVFTKLLHSYVGNDVAMQGNTSEQEMAALGDDAGKRLNGIADWGKANLPEDEYDGLLSITTTAQGVQAVEALIAKTRTPQIPARDIDTGASQISKSDLQARVADPRYQSDPAFRKETADMYERVYGKEPQRQIM